MGNLLLGAVISLGFLMAAVSILGFFWGYLELGLLLFRFLFSFFY